LAKERSNENKLKVSNEEKENNGFQKNQKVIEEFFKKNIEEMMDNNKKLIDMREKHRLLKLNYLGSKELCYEMDPFIWELIKFKDGSTKINIIDENDQYKNWEKDKVLEEDIIRIRNFEANQNQDENEEEEEAPDEIIPITFEDRRKVIDNFYKENFEIRRSSFIIRWNAESEKERIRRLAEERKRPDYLSKLGSWKFFKCTNDKVRISQVRSRVEKMDPIARKRAIDYWDQQNNVTFVKKRKSGEERKALQEKVDKLEIIKGFTKVVWQYCTFTPEEYEKRKEKLKIERGYCEIFISKLYMEEYDEEFNGLYGAYCTRRGDTFTNQ
jgi:hypothetical protein